MDAKLKHRNHKRVTPVHSLGVLGKAVRLVQSVTIPSPIEIVVLCRIFALAFDLLDFLRNQTADDFLTFCRDFSPPFRSFFFKNRARTEAKAAPASAPGAATPFGFRQPRRVRWLPRHPTRAASAALLRLGRFRSAVSRGARTLLRAPALANRPPPVASLHGPTSPQQHRLAAAGSAGCARCAQPLLRYSGSAGQLQGLRPPLLPPRYAVGVCYRRQRLLLCPSAAAAAPAHNQSLYAAGARLCAAPYNAGLCATAAAHRLGYDRPQ